MQNNAYVVDAGSGDILDARHLDTINPEIDAESLHEIPKDNLDKYEKFKQTSPIIFHNYHNHYDFKHSPYIDSTTRCYFKRLRVLKERFNDPLKWDIKYMDILEIVKYSDVSYIVIPNVTGAIYETTKTSDKSIIQDFIKNFWYNPKHKAAVKSIIDFYNYAKK